jgi:hypothetical protein
MTKIAGSGSNRQSEAWISGSVLKCPGSATLPYSIIIDPYHCILVGEFTYLSVRKNLCFFQEDEAELEEEEPEEEEEREVESSRGRVYIPASNHNPNMLAYPPPPKPEHFISPLTLAEVQEQQEEEERVRDCLTRTKTG